MECVSANCVMCSWSSSGWYWYSTNNEVLLYSISYLKLYVNVNVNASILLLLLLNAGAW